MEVSEKFELIGQPFALVLATLGLPMNTLVKVRRRCHPRGVTPQGGKPLTPMGHSDPGGLDSSGDGDSVAANRLSDEGDEDSNGLSWACRIGTGVAALAGRPAIGGGGGVGLVALRRRPLWYQRLEDGDSREQSPVFEETEEACIEMPTKHTGRVADAAVADGGGAPATEGASRAGSGGAALNFSGGVIGFEDICDVSPKDYVRPGDVLVLSCDRETMVRAIGSAVSRRGGGLKVLGVSAAKLPRHGTVLLELVLSRSSHNFLGRTARLDNAYFAAMYGCVIVAFRLKGSAGYDGSSESSSGGCDSSGGGGDGDGRHCIDSGSGVDFNRPNVGIGRTGYKATANADPAATATSGLKGVDDAFVTSRNGSPTSVRSPLRFSAVTSSTSMASVSPALASPALTGGDSPFVEPESGPSEEEKAVTRRRKGEALASGDVVVVLAPEGFLEEASSKREFLREGRVGRLPEPTGWFHYCPLLIFAAMLAWVLAVGVDMVREGGRR